MIAALVALALMFFLLGIGFPIGFAMASVGFGGFVFFVGFQPAANMVAQIAFDTSITYVLSVLPLFILMGSLFAHSRMADELYDAAYAFMGHWRGGLAMATIMACSGFSAVSGSSLACAATFARVSVPTMRRYDYSLGFAAGTVAIGSTLDILIPPSITMVIYALITDVNLGKLMVAGLLPGLLTIVLYLLAIVVVTRIWPDIGPRGHRTSWSRRIAALRKVWTMVLLFTVSLGGIYLGVFTPTEAAGVGAAGAFLIALFRKRLKLLPLLSLLAETARTTSAIFIIVIGALIFSNFLTVSGAAAELQAAVSSLKLSSTALIIAMLAIYILLGCILDASAMMLLTVPVFFPIVVAASIDPIWFGIFIVIVIGFGMVHPPLGMLLFVVKRYVPELTTTEIFLGVAPFLAADFIRIVLLIMFPAIVLVLPNMMR